MSYNKNKPIVTNVETEEKKEEKKKEEIKPVSTKKTDSKKKKTKCIAVSRIWSIPLD